LAATVNVAGLKLRERGFYIFSQPTRLYRYAMVVSNLVRTSVLNVYHVYTV